MQIAQLGIETRAAYETEWIPYEERSSKRQFMLKAVTRSGGLDGKEYRTTNVRIACAETRPGTWVVYHRELPSNEIGIASVIRLAVGGNVLVLQRGETKGTNDQHSVIANREFVARALAAGSIAFTETFSPRDARAWSRDVRLSTAGLEQALHTSLKNCGQR